MNFFQQWRLIPKLAATYALAYFARTFFMNFVELQVGLMMGATAEEQVRVMICFHLNGDTWVFHLFHVFYDNTSQKQKQRPNQLLIY